jgi:hypothetical protein
MYCKNRNVIVKLAQAAKTDPKNCASDEFLHSFNRADLLNHYQITLYRAELQCEYYIYAIYVSQLSNLAINARAYSCYRLFPVPLEIPGRHFASAAQRGAMEVA